MPGVINELFSARLGPDSLLWWENTVHRPSNLLHQTLGVVRKFLAAGRLPGSIRRERLDWARNSIGVRGRDEVLLVCGRAGARPSLSV